MRNQLNRRIVMLEARVPVTGRHKKPLPDWLVAEFVAQGAPETRRDAGLGVITGTVAMRRCSTSRSTDSRLTLLADADKNNAMESIEARHAALQEGYCEQLSIGRSREIAVSS